ncbi:hypothetical protein CC85DRAFT_327715 [Cutaneotrichosporon oleaginosum]|uniref:Granulins domain-containing protein n=1 Tax=Cutaneotrichosporon oleaginosum TaxID=879819 RepID=A0A0J0XPM4_9TREE|nr:uncharacterized protein CC85DRAFT_327715 [Cutaneotrichosporon oleaginosum]KLT43017.1 hypothetical protein CC85DRAFT_327715 [Cutaneotrichosporon oleaginosum]TXT11780.1 hypothetical protein COLE_02190 [Cutaneotrichosporon oleaginosum]
MKLLASVLALLSLAAASPLPNADADAAPSPLTGNPRPTTPFDSPQLPKPTKAYCRPVVCVRAPCLDSCCPSGKRSCPMGWYCTKSGGGSERCCPPNMYCPPDGPPRPCDREECGGVYM